MKTLKALALGLALALAASWAGAQSYPDRPVRLIVLFPRRWRAAVRWPPKRPAPAGSSDARPTRPGERKVNRPSPHIVAWAGRGKRRFAAVLLLSEPGLAVAAVVRSQCAARAAWLG